MEGSVSSQRNWTPDSFCERCTSINLKKIAEGDFGPWFRLEELIRDSSICPFCHFILSSIEDNSDTPVIRRCRGENNTAMIRLICAARTSEPLPRPVEVQYMPESGPIIMADAVLQPEDEDLGQTMQVIVPDRIDYEKIKDWIKGCHDKHHDTCNVPSRPHEKPLSIPTGFKLIDCTRRSIIYASRSQEYVALSYVWGAKAATEHSSSDSLSSSLDGSICLPDNIPRTIEDAITVVMALGMNYLWVDKYCIDQSDPLALHQQLSCMDRIYEQADLTIVAACGDASYGLPGVSTVLRSSQARIKINGKTWTSRKFGERVIPKSFWSSRAWTYQETIFSRRQLIFTAGETFWQCNELCLAESFEPKLTQHIRLSQRFQHQPYTKHFLQTDVPLSQHIELYTRRKLSYQSDALNGIRGVFELLARRSPPIRQIWGISTIPHAYYSGFTTPWEAEYQKNPISVPRGDHMIRPEATLNTTFAFGLLWGKGDVRSCPRRSGFPSWSWSGWITEVKWPEWRAANILDDWMLSFSIVNNETEDQSLEEYLPSERMATNSEESPKLRVTALVLRLKFSLIDDTKSYSRNPYKEDVPWLRLESHNFSMWSFHPTPAIKRNDAIMHALLDEGVDCIVLSNQYGLVVWGPGDVKERIGRIDFNYQEKGFRSRGFEEDQITRVLWPRPRNNLGQIVEQDGISPQERRDYWLKHKRTVLVA